MVGGMAEGARRASNMVDDASSMVGDIAAQTAAIASSLQDGKAQLPLNSDDPKFMRKLAFLIDEAWKGERSVYVEEGADGYLQLAGYCQYLEHTGSFHTLIIVTIIVAGALVGIETSLSGEPPAALGVLNTVVLTIFVFECGVKIAAKGRNPLAYFSCRWNVFDFLIVFVSVVEAMLPNTKGDVVVVVRMVRLFRISKLFNSVDELKVSNI